MLLERTSRLGEAAMTFMPEIKDRDVELVQNAMSEMPNSTSVAEFVPHVFGTPKDYHGGEFQ